ncbi:Uncharacterised protein [Klebsiella pneumoniae]|nr:Uncharacterised protein [Klebsiella pneumoniae]
MPRRVLKTKLGCPGMLAGAREILAASISGRRELYRRITEASSRQPAASSAPCTVMVSARWPQRNEPSARPPYSAVWYSARARALIQSGTRICTAEL